MSGAWDPRQIYAQGEVVTVGATSYTSAQNYNYNNAPATTTGWWTASSGSTTTLAAMTNASGLALSSIDNGPFVPAGTGLSGNVFVTNLSVVAQKSIAGSFASPPAAGSSVAVAQANLTNLLPNTTYVINCVISFNRDPTTPIIWEPGVDRGYFYCSPPFVVTTVDRSSTTSFTSIPNVSTGASAAVFVNTAFTTKTNSSGGGGFIGLTVVNNSGTVSWAGGQFEVYVSPLSGRS